MVTLPASSRVFWPGTNASIPAGFTRDTAFDGRFCQGADSSYTGPVNGGAATHTHTFAAHGAAHGSSVHRHLLTGDAATPAASVIVGSGSAQGITYAPTHDHGWGKYTPYNSGDSWQATVVTTDAAAATPPYMKLIVIKPDDANQGVANGIVLHLDQTTAPAGFDLCDGAGGTPNLHSLASNHILGADPGGDGGATGFGFGHTHAQSHTHIALGSHVHGATASSVPTGGAPVNARSSGTILSARGWAHHFVTDNAQTSELSDNTDATSASDPGSHRPAYTQLAAIQNTSGTTVDVPVNAIVAFVGSYASIPRADGWYLCDGVDHPSTPDCVNRQILCSGSEPGLQGGSNTHIHSLNHVHNGVVHTPTVASTTFGGQVKFPISTGVYSIDIDHAHNWTYSPAGPPTTSTANLTSDIVDHRLPYRTVLWIKFVGRAVPGAMNEYRRRRVA